MQVRLLIVMMAALMLTAQATFEVAVIKPNAEGRIDLGNGVSVLSGFQRRSS